MGFGAMPGRLWFQSLFLCQIRNCLENLHYGLGMPTAATMSDGVGGEYVRTDRSPQQRAPY